MGHHAEGERMNKEEWRDEMANWWDEFPWLWFCILTFRPGLTESQSRWRLHKWAGELCAALGNKNFEWVAVPETGRTGLDFHFHVLVGGLNDWHADERLNWMRHWNKLAGDALITVFKPGIGGVRYVLKHIGPGDMDKIEFHLVSRTRLQSQFGAK
jgi:hypothetical protein